MFPSTAFPVGEPNIPIHWHVTTGDTSPPRFQAWLCDLLWPIEYEWIWQKPCLSSFKGSHMAWLCLLFFSLCQENTISQLRAAPSQDMSQNEKAHGEGPEWPPCSSQHERDWSSHFCKIWGSLLLQHNLTNSDNHGRLYRDTSSFPFSQTETTVLPPTSCMILRKSCNIFWP